MRANGKHADLTRRIIGAAHEVHNELGFGFVEKVYETALVHELRSDGLTVDQQVAIDVVYKGERVGDYVADLIVAGKVIVEVKATKQLADAHGVQLVNYLKATGIEVGLLVNFGHRVDARRKILDR